jgi:iron complex outermembrane receptor protein
MSFAKHCARASVSVLALAAMTPAFAQSTGTQEFDQAIVVTGSNTPKAVAGVQIPDTTKSRQVLTQDFIKNQREGQSIDDIINYIPGVSFQNNDPYGNQGGTINIHGFDATRISQTFDGVPLNDAGNYAIYSSEGLDSELIDQVNVSLGSTDIDSPTASATGSTVNYTTRLPTEDFHVRLSGSFGQWDYLRMFGVVDTGAFGPFGTRLFLAASHAENNNPFNSAVGLQKEQYNFKLYQPVGSNGDFVSVAGQYNHGRSGNFSSVPLRTDLTQSPTNPAARIVGTGSTNRFPLSTDERDYTIPHCTVAAATPGVRDVPNSCGTAFDNSFNPDDNGNIRVNSRFTIADGLVLTVDPSFQFVKANGGSSAVKGNEGTDSVKGVTGLEGYIGGQPYAGGVDLNGDGDKLDQVELYAPSLTRTHRFIINSSLRYDLTPSQTVRVSYVFDHSRVIQTGEVGFLKQDGEAVSVFPDTDPILDANGHPLEKRNRTSYATLNQVSGEYRGHFFDDKLTIDAGVRAPFFRRDLHNRCVSETGSNIGFVDCIPDPTQAAAFAAANGYVLPGQRILHYNKVLPSGGLTYDLVRHVELFANYSKSIQVPGTDNLYNAFGVPADSQAANPKPETTDNLVAGVRYKSGKVQAEASGWYTFYKNRLASFFDPIQDITIYRNLGTVHKYGADASVSYQPIQQLTLYAFGSYLKSKILNNVVSGECTAAQVTSHASAGVGTCTTAGQSIFALTAGKRESGAPVYLFGGRAQGNFGPLQIGIQAKRTGPRYINDQNLPEFANGVTNPATFGTKTPAYTLVDLDARFSLKAIGLNDATWVQVNVTNLFDKLYVAGFTGNTSATSVPFSFIGAPRTVSGTINFGF